MNQSEIARLRQQIELQLEATQRGLRGFATGKARHAFIRMQMDRIGMCQDTLAEHIGENAASQVVCSLYVEIMGC
jgi:hypothetical protein